MAIKITRVKSGDQLTDFINLPYKIYNPLSLWVPSLKKDEKSLLTPGKHPFWHTAERELFMAWDGDRPIGRIAAIVDHKYNDYAAESCGAFGFFECENNNDAAIALLEASKRWLVDQGMTFMRGPLNPSTNYSCGMLVQGFEHSPSLMMPWNHPYYPALLENWNMRKEQDMFAYLLRRDSLAVPEWMRVELKRIREEGNFIARPSSKTTLAEDVRAMLKIYRESWADNWGFSPVSEQEAERLVRDLTAILDPEFFVLFFHNDEPVAGMVALPDLNPLLKRLNGSIGLSAPWHYFLSRKHIHQGYRIMLFGILPKYRLQGVPMLLLDHMLNIVRNHKGLEWVEGSWVLENNAPIDDLIEDFGGIITKRYRIYRREIASG